MVEKTVDINIIKIVEQYIDIISEKFNVKEVYIFGSCAKEHGKQSTHQRNDQGIDYASDHGSGVEAPELLPVAQGKGVDPLGALEEPRQEDAAVLEHHHEEKEDAHRGDGHSRQAAP